MTEYYQDQIHHAQVALGLATAIVTAKLMIKQNPEHVKVFDTALDQVCAKLTTNLSEQLKSVESDETREIGDNTITLIEQLKVQYKDELFN